jgi:hypothetical protein
VYLKKKYKTTSKSDLIIHSHKKEIAGDLLHLGRVVSGKVYAIVLLGWLELFGVFLLVGKGIML